RLHLHQDRDPKRRRDSKNQRVRAQQSREGTRGLHQAQRGQPDRHRIRTQRRQGSQDLQHPLTRSPQRMKPLVFPFLGLLVMGASTQSTPPPPPSNLPRRPPTPSANERQISPTVPSPAPPPPRRARAAPNRSSGRAIRR